MNPETGAGRICKLKSSVSVQKAVELVKARISLPHVRLALGAGKTMGKEFGDSLDLKLGILLTKYSFIKILQYHL